jgi:hypothetical protein
MATTTKTTARSGNRTPHQAGKAASPSRRWSRVAQGTAAGHPPLYAGWRAHGVRCMREAAETPLAQQRGKSRKKPTRKAQVCEGCDAVGVAVAGLRHWHKQLQRWARRGHHRPGTHHSRGARAGAGKPRGLYAKSRRECRVYMGFCVRDVQWQHWHRRTWWVGRWAWARGTRHGRRGAPGRDGARGEGGGGGGSVGGLTWSGCALRLTHTPAKPQRF